MIFIYYIKINIMYICISYIYIYMRHAFVYCTSSNGVMPSVTHWNRSSLAVGA